MNCTVQSAQRISVASHRVPEMNHARGSYGYTMGVLYGEKMNMADETAVKFKSKLCRRDDSAKVFDSTASCSNCTLDSL